MIQLFLATTLVISFVKADTNTLPPSWNKCTEGNHDAVLPCVDTIPQLTSNDIFTTTFFGHSCYAFSIYDGSKSSSSPSMYFIDTSVYHSHIQNTNKTIMKSTLSLLKPFDCNNTADDNPCLIYKEDHFIHSEYTFLVIGESNSINYAVESCDPYSFFEYILLITGSIIGMCLAAGFACSSVEYLLGIEILKTSGTRPPPRRKFVELSQEEPDVENQCCDDDELLDEQPMSEPL